MRTRRNDETASVQTLTDIGKELFFPNGRCSKGKHIDEVSVSLANFARQQLEKFTDKTGKECSMKGFLHARGLYTSKTA